MSTPEPRRSAAPYGVTAPNSGILLTSPRKRKLANLLGVAAVLIVAAILLVAYLLAGAFFPR